MLCSEGVKRTARMTGQSPSNAGKKTPQHSDSHSANNRPCSVRLHWPDDPTTDSCLCDHPSAHLCHCSSLVAVLDGCLLGRCGASVQDDRGVGCRAGLRHDHHVRSGVGEGLRANRGGVADFGGSGDGGGGRMRHRTAGQERIDDGGDRTAHGDGRRRARERGQEKRWQRGVTQEVM